ncbi:fungal-specific transcription factor domain-containing protein [Mycena sp. CBHHK59/15]|nr:fungal-specific transcription factor domain-containing protein [Mycena sp. CBHHK59/15]
MEKLLNKLLPGIDFTEQFENELEAPHLLDTEALPRNDADQLLGAIRKLTLNPEEHRFFGKSSGIQFVQTALNFKSHFTGNITRPILTEKRPTFWEPVQWLLPSPDDEENPQYTFPDPDLLVSLVELYFTEANCFYPVLHRPTFERKLADKLHLRDHRFASTVLMVCSLGARHSDDPRVFLDGQTTCHSAGWKYHNQVAVIPKHLIYKPTLYELQTIALSSIFLLAVSPVSWNQIGFGLRRAQDVGAHRRRNQPRPTAENEQWKRVFWVLLCLDWLTGTATGRPMAMHDGDFDQDSPLECDDEYWDLPEPNNFKQPKDKPSVISYFVCFAKLLEIQASVTNTIYSPRRPKDLSGRPLPPNDAQNIIAFDSALNSWLLEIPDHLRWDPERKDKLYFLQSATLYAGYYHVQIMVHRPYIPAPLETARPGALPSLAICTNAARSCARIIHAQDKLGIPPNPNMLPATFTSALVLLMNTWSGKRSGFAYNPGKEMEDVNRCMKMLAAGEKRYLAAGRFNDILVRLISAGGNANEFSLAKPPCDRTAPPALQHVYEELSVFSTPQTSEDCSSSSVPYLADMQASSDAMDELLRPRAHDLVVPLEHQYRQSEASMFTSHNGHPDMHPVGELDLENYDQLMRMDPSQFSSDMLVDTDVMSMWSAAPTGFQVADWENYIMSNGVLPPQANNFYATPQTDQEAP